MDHLGENRSKGDMSNNDEESPSRMSGPNLQKTAYTQGHSLGDLSIVSDPTT